ncbi:MAG: hypothetical protein KJO69_01150 [Gammaproteobacteria bacterium]|nr:hypothetical protein [Gammaproteobacteria bacterium]
MDNEKYDILLKSAKDTILVMEEHNNQIMQHLLNLLEYTTSLEEFQHDMNNKNIDLADFGLFTVEEDDNIHVYYGMPKNEGATH